MDFEGPK